MATLEELYEQINSAGQEELEKNWAQRQQTTEDTISQIKQAIDKAADTGVAGYKQSMEQAPLDALKQKGKNALQEEINRKIVAENMANMGLTDSGLNRSQQTALTLQRGNADAAVDQSTQEYVNKLQLAIEEVMSNAETAKAEKETALKQADSDWYTAAKLEYENSARTAAAEAYAAEQKRLAEIHQADIDAQAEQDKLRQQWMLQRVDDLGSDLAYAEAVKYYPTGDDEENNKHEAYYNTYQTAIQQGFSEEEAAAAATLAANGADTQSAILSVATANLPTDLVSLYDGLNTWGRFEAAQKGLVPGVSAEEQAKKWDVKKDWPDVIERMANKAAENVEKSYGSKSESIKQYAIAKAVITALQPVTEEGSGYSDETVENITTLVKNKFGDETVDMIAEELGIGSK